MNSRPVYHFNHENDRYEVPYGELGGTYLADLPVHCRVEITDLGLPDHWYSSVSIVNSGDEGTDDSITCYGEIAIPNATMGEAGRQVALIKRALPNLPKSFVPNPVILPEENAVYLFLAEDLDGKGASTVQDAIKSVLTSFQSVEGPKATVFICHASEDKPVAKRLARQIKNLGADVWLDEWEIKVGDSIVEKINGGIGEATHLCLLMSVHSANRPWVAREMSAALMRQLADKSVSILPVRIDATPLPALLADIRYADLRHPPRKYLKELREALFAG